MILQAVVTTKSDIRPFAGANVNFLPLVPPNLNDINESDGFVVVRVELGGAMLASAAYTVTLQSLNGMKQQLSYVVTDSSLINAHAS